jgi:hypothetical protein
MIAFGLWTLHLAHRNPDENCFLYKGCQHYNRNLGRFSPNLRQRGSMMVEAASGSLRGLVLHLNT